MFASILELTFRIHPIPELPAVMKRFSVLVPIVILFLCGADVLQAMTVVARDFDQIVTRADTIFKGTVTSKMSEWTGEGNTRHIVTFVTF